MALPDSWLDHLFGKLAVRYGDAWLRKWDGVPMTAVRADWSQVLDGLSGEAIAYGLRYLPAEHPPTATAFRALCNARPLSSDRLLPSPRMPVNHEAVARIRAKVAEFAAAATARASQAAQKRERPVLGPLPERPRVPQGPLPWPRGVQRSDGEVAA